MNRIGLTGTLAALAWLVIADGAIAQNAPRGQAGPQAQQQTQERIFGSQLMTRAERAEYRRRMHAARTPEERARIRDEHHDQMMVRAKERGITLPAQPQGGRQRGAGMGSGMGGGMGPGSGGGRPPAD